MASELNNENMDEAASMELEAQLKDQANMLKSCVDEGRISDAIGIIGDLNQTRDLSLYREVGRLTRSLHEAIRNFHLDGSIDKDRQEEMSMMADASDRLSYVVEMTSNAANKTMDLVEETMPIASEIRTEAGILRDDWSRLKKREMEPEEFRKLYKKIDGFLEQISSQSDTVYGNLSQILLAQDFQDLTGQVIQKVSTLVQELESNLVHLIKMAGHVDKITGTEHQFEERDTEADMLKGEGPQINAEVQPDVVSGQDDVDDLLSSLGF